MSTKKPETKWVDNTLYSVGEGGVLTPMPKEKQKTLKQRVNESLPPGEYNTKTFVKALEKENVDWRKTKFKAAKITITATSAPQKLTAVYTDNIDSPSFLEFHPFAQKFPEFADMTVREAFSKEYVVERTGVLLGMDPMLGMSFQVNDTDHPGCSTWVNHVVKIVVHPKEEAPKNVK